MTLSEAVALCLVWLAPRAIPLTCYWVHVFGCGAAPKNGHCLMEVSFMWRYYEYRTKGSVALESTTVMVQC